MKSDQRVFRGVCDSCGESYETRSKVDDLKGLKFKCQKGFCPGHVALEPISPEMNQLSPSKSLDKTPRRFC